MNPVEALTELFAAPAPPTDRSAYKRHWHRHGGRYVRCAATTAFGAPCRRWALLEGEYCAAHDPERHADVIAHAERMRKARRCP